MTFAAASLVLRMASARALASSCTPSESSCAATGNAAAVPTPTPIPEFHPYHTEETDPATPDEAWAVENGAGVFFTDEKPDLANGLALRLDSCGEEILRRILAGIGRTSASAAPVALEMVRGKPGEACDQNLWAKFAWRFGWGMLRELTLQGVAEMREHRRPMKDKDKPKVLQRLINGVWKDSKRTTTREAK